MAQGAGVNGIAIGAVAVGALLVYSGVTGRGALAVLQATIRGQAPSTAPVGDTIEPGATVGAVAGGAAGQIGGTEPPAHSPSGTATGAKIASDAQKYIGTGYVFGGAPAGDINRKDCSSFVSWVVGVDNGLAIPGYPAGTWDGHTHGPTALAWSLWTGATTVSHDGKDALPGDLCCWQTHMGIAIGGGMMVSARSASAQPPTGTGEINSGKPGEFLSIRRLKEV